MRVNSTTLPVGWYRRGGAGAQDGHSHYLLWGKAHVGWACVTSGHSLRWTTPESMYDLMKKKWWVPGVGKDGHCPLCQQFDPLRFALEDLLDGDDGPDS